MRDGERAGESDSVRLRTKQREKHGGREEMEETETKQQRRKRVYGRERKTQRNKENKKEKKTEKGQTKTIMGEAANTT